MEREHDRDHLRPPATTPCDRERAKSARPPSSAATAPATTTRCRSRSRAAKAPGCSTRRPPLSRHDERLLGRQLRPRPSALLAALTRRRSASPCRQPRLLQRPARAVPRAALRGRPAWTAALPMNTGAEAVETAIKAARKWGYRVKGVAADRAEIIVAPATSTAAPRPSSASRPRRSIATASARSRRAFASVPFGDLAALERAITPQHGRGPGRADPGRGRHHRAAGRLPRRVCAPSAAATACC